MTTIQVDQSEGQATFEDQQDASDDGFDLLSDGIDDFGYYVSAQGPYN